MKGGLTGIEGLKEAWIDGQSQISGSGEVSTIRIINPTYILV